MRRLYKYALIALFCVVVANAFMPAVFITLSTKLLYNRVHADKSIGDKTLEQFQDMYEAARDKGLEGYEKFVEALHEHQKHLDEEAHPEKKSWTTAAKEKYDAAVDKIKDWECQAEEKMHELRYGPSSYSCDAKSVAQKAKDKAKYVVGYDDLEQSFENARDEGKEQLHTLVESVKAQREKLEKMYDDILEKASKAGDVSSDKAKEWREHFKQSAGDSLRSFREMSDGFEQRIQDFLGTDHKRWGFFSKLKFW